MSENSFFYRNVFLLTQLVPPSNDFNKYFKEGMFDKPNTAGFIYISHYLLTIYDEQKFKKNVEWPILEKKSEGKYRNEVRDFMSTIALENPDIGFPSIQPSHLFHAGGHKFINLMWKLSQAVLKIYLQRQRPDCMHAAPRPGPCDELSKMLFHNLVADDIKNLLERHKHIQDIESRAQNELMEMAKSVEQNQLETFELWQRLSTVAANSRAHSDVQTRIADPNDYEVIQLWKTNVYSSLDYLQRKTTKLKDISDKSEKIALMVKSILSRDLNCLDANNFPKINVQRLLELPMLRPEMQVALHHLYKADKLNLPNLMILFNCMLEIIQTNLSNFEFPDLSDCNLQIEASMADLKSMRNPILNMETTVMSLKSEMNSKESNGIGKNHNLSIQLSENVYHTVVLESSPTIHINSNGYDSDKNDAQLRLELTPVEGVHKSLFIRYKNNENPFVPRVAKSRPKFLVSRINFDDTISSSIGDRLSPAKRLLTQQSVSQCMVTKSGKFSRLFGSNNRTLANCSIASAGSWKMSTMVDNSIVEDIKYSFNVSRELSTPVKASPQKQPNRFAIKIMNQFDKPAFNSTEIVPELTRINENSEIKICMGLSPKPKLIVNPQEKKNNRRRSISDLVERFKKVRENSATNVFMEHSSGACDDDVQAS